LAGGCGRAGVLVDGGSWGTGLAGSSAAGFLAEGASGMFCWLGVAWAKLRLAVRNIPKTATRNLLLRLVQVI
jgi:heme exporter protein D